MSKNYKDSAVHFVEVFFELADRVKNDPEAISTNNRIPINFDLDLVRTETHYEIRSHRTNARYKAVAATWAPAVGKLLERYLEIADIK